MGHLVCKSLAASVEEGVVQVGMSGESTLVPTLDGEAKGDVGSWEGGAQH